MMKFLENVYTQLGTDSWIFFILCFLGWLMVQARRKKNKQDEQATSINFPMGAFCILLGIANLGRVISYFYPSAFAFVTLFKLFAVAYGLRAIWVLPKSKAQRRAHADGIHAIKEKNKELIQELEKLRNDSSRNEPL